MNVTASRYEAEDSGRDRGTAKVREGGREGGSRRPKAERAKSEKVYEARFHNGFTKGAIPVEIKVEVCFPRTSCAWEIKMSYWEIKMS